MQPLNISNNFFLKQVFDIHCPSIILCGASWALKSLVCRGGQLRLTAPSAGKGQKVKKLVHIFAAQCIWWAAKIKKQVDMSCTGGHHTKKVLHSKYNISFLC
jgi:hypothetical protein